MRRARSSLVDYSPWFGGKRAETWMNWVEANLLGCLIFAHCNLLVPPPSYFCSFFFFLTVQHWRFWLTSMTCLLLYLILLLQQFRRSQGEFAHRLCCARAPHEEVQYVHLVFAHEAYTSFLSFRRLFVAAAPAFSAPSASSSGATALIPPSLPSSLLWSPTRSAVPSRYPISHLQHVLPVAPLFFGNVYVVRAAKSSSPADAAADANAATRFAHSRRPFFALADVLSLCVFLCFLMLHT